MLTFEGIAELKAWLKAKGIDTTLWGSGQAKSVENLWAELVAGESQIQDDPPLRLVRMVTIMIRDGDKILVEAAQEFGENQQRYRGWPPAEKIKPGESPAEAALRCLHEELQVASNQVEILSWTFQPELAHHESPSYPGLLTNYLRYEVEAKVDGLPGEPFWTSETARDDGDPVRNHHWLWEPAER
jgi:ADP-ribose pyrophosphatase YjhB (NUDIX family)